MAKSKNPSKKTKEAEESNYPIPVSEIAEIVLSGENTHKQLNVSGKVIKLTFLKEPSGDIFRSINEYTFALRKEFEKRELLKYRIWFILPDKSQLFSTL